MKFLVTLERDEAGFIVAECPALPGCLSQGRTEAEALANIREAIEASERYDESADSDERTSEHLLPDQR
jgi:predicted RNase H-like HicB family nuclease